MPVVSSAGLDVVPHTSVAAILLAANTHLVRLGLRHPGTTDILNATGASRSRAYELKDRLEARLGTLTAPAGRPSAPSPTPSPQPLATRVLSYVLEHAGCVRGGSRQRDYSDDFTHFVMELMAEHPGVSVEALAQTILVPAGTLKDWRRRAAAAVADAGEDPRSGGPVAPMARRPDPMPRNQASEARRTSHDAPTDPPDISIRDRGKRQGLHIETVLAEWRRWDGRFRPFCDHLQQHCAIPFGTTLIAGILEALGVRIPKRRAGRSPDELALRNAFETFFPHAQWVGDGTQVVVEVDGEPVVFNVELNVDAHSAAFVGAHVSPTEDSAAVIAAFDDARRTTGVRPIALLLDNKPSNHTPEVDETLESTLRIRATPYRPQNKAHVEGAFGLLKPTLEGLTLTGGSPRQVAASFLRALVITAGRAINHRPRKDRGGRSRADLLTDTPSSEDVLRATEALEQRLQKQTLARQTRAARQDPVVRATLEEACRRLGFDDPEGHQRTATARYPLDAVVEGIAIFESRKRTNKLPAGVDARYLHGIIVNIDEENDAWDLAMALWDERVRARDHIAVLLDQQLQRVGGTATTPEQRVVACAVHAIHESRRLHSFFWLRAAADVIRATPETEHQHLFRVAARRIASTHAVPLERRLVAQRFLAAQVRPLR